MQKFIAAQEAWKVFTPIEAKKFATSQTMKNELSGSFKYGEANNC